MPNFYSPEGNFEVWEKKPKGYFTEEEWMKNHPVPVYEPTKEELEMSVRAERDFKLSVTDKYLLADFPISENDLAKVKEYRQALRDITKQSGFPSKIEWPLNPMED